MGIGQKAYLTFFYDYTEPPGYDSSQGPIITEPVKLPVWFTNAAPHFRKLIRILGTTASYFVPGGDDEDLSDIKRGIRLYGNISKDFIDNGFIMMINNYNSQKQYDVTHNNIRELVWWMTDRVGEIFPPARLHVDLVIEIELVITDDDDD